MRVPVIVLIAIDAGAALAQPVCPPVNFQVLSQVQLQNRPQAILSGLLRQQDQSFSQLEITGNVQTKTASPVTTVPDINQSFFACIGLAARTPKPGAAPNISVDPLGVGQRNTIITDLAGNGVGAVVGLDQEGAPDEVVAVTANPDYSVKFSAEYPIAGQTAMGVLAGDFNGDGKHDVAAVYFGPLDDSAPGGVTIFLGNGTGALQRSGSFSAGLTVTGAAVWDFNGDGKDDLAVVSNGAGTVTILFGSASGTLTMGNSYAVGTNSSPGSVAVADVNGDKIPDLVVGSDAGIFTLFGNGDGTFRTGAATALDTIESFVATGDFNNDGKTDVALADYEADVLYIALGNGDGTFTLAETYPVAYALGTYGNQGTYYVEDFDGDGNLDIVFASGHPDALATLPFVQTVGVMFGNGDGTFTGAPAYNVPAQNPASIVTANFNHDGNLDLALGGQSGQVSVLLGQGGSKFQSGSNLTLANAGALPTAVAAGDVNGDNNVDLAINDGNSGAAIFLGNGDGTFQAPMPVEGDGSGTSYVVLGKFTNSGNLDLALANSASNSVSVALGKGGGSFGTANSTPVGLNPTVLLAADFNKDGHLDLAVVDSGNLFENGENGGLSILLGKGDGTFQNAVNYPAGMNPASISTGDVNNDGVPDLVLTAMGPNYNYNLVVFLGKGDGSFQPGVLYPTQFGPGTVAIADYNGDGNADLVVPHCCGDTYTTYLLGNGDGTFQPESIISLGNGLSSVVADFNGDGKPDIAFSGQGVSTGNASIYLNISKPSPQPVINHVISASGYGAFPDIAAGSWFEIYGTNLAADSRPWAGSDFNGVNAPTSLDGTSVQVNGAPAYIYYISSGQINALAPENVTPGTASVTVTAGGVPSEAFPVQLLYTEPAMLSPAGFNVQGTQYVVAQFSDGTYVLPTGAIPGYTSRPAMPGETITIYGIGFGPAENPAQQIAPVGQIASGDTNLTAGFTASIGHTAAKVSYAGLAPGAVGLYQFNVVVPSVPAGNAVPFTFTLGGTAGQQTLYTAVE